MSKKYGLLEAPVHFFRKDFLQDVAQHWRGLALMYLLLLCVYCSFFDGHKGHRHYQDLYNDIFATRLADLPALKFDGQTLAFKDESLDKRFEVTDKSGDDFILFDFTGESEDKKGLLTVNSEKVYFRVSKDQWFPNHVMAVASFFGLDGENDLSREEQQTFLRRTLNFSLFFFVLTATISNFLVQAFYMLIFSALLYFMWKTISPEQFLRNLKFKTLFRLCIVTYTPVIVIQTVLRYFDYTNQFWDIAFTIVHVLFIHYACVASQDGGGSGTRTDTD